jgi:hypothetical protein
MPITAFLHNQAFEPELIEAMSAAFTEACSTLGLADRTDPITEIVARKVIEAAQCGLRTQTRYIKARCRNFRMRHQRARERGDPTNRRALSGEGTRIRECVRLRKPVP